MFPPVKNAGTSHLHSMFRRNARPQPLRFTWILVPAHAHTLSSYFWVLSNLSCAFLCIVCHSLPSSFHFKSTRFDLSFYLSKIAAVFPSFSTLPSRIPPSHHHFVVKPPHSSACGLRCADIRCKPPEAHVPTPRRAIVLPHRPLSHHGFITSHLLSARQGRQEIPTTTPAPVL